MSVHSKKRPARAHLAVLLIATLMCLSLTGCFGGQDDTSGETSATEERTIILYAGCQCGPLWDDLLDAYEADHPVDFRRAGQLHCADAIRGVCEEDLDMASVAGSYLLEDEEGDLVFTCISHDPLVMAVSPGLGIDGLTTEQIRSIYSGECTNWAGVGGPDLEIWVADRADERSSRPVAVEAFFGEDLVVTDDAIILPNEEEVIALLEGTPGAIGYFSAGLGNWVSTSVEYLAIDGIQPTSETVSAGMYPAIRDRGFVTCGNPSQVVQDFVDWLSSPEAVRIVEDNGYLPHYE